MLWKLTRLWIELFAVIIVLKVFVPCRSVADVWFALQAADDTQRMGLIVAAAILVDGVVDVLVTLGLRDVWDWLRRRWGGGG